MQRESRITLADVTLRVGLMQRLMLFDAQILSKYIDNEQRYLRSIQI